MFNRSTLTLSITFIASLVARPSGGHAQPAAPSTQDAGVSSTLEPAPSDALSASDGAEQPEVPDDAETREGDIQVTGRRRDVAQRMESSAESVGVVETREDRARGADLGEVLARSQSVAIRRGGGLGSTERLSLDGLTDDQIRFFLDGVPLERSGYPLGPASVPVNLVERVEIYRGVVPIRFGTDALGGAVNLVSEEPERGTHASASYQLASFATHRVTLAAHHLKKQPQGFVLGLQGFVDRADNDYPMDVELLGNLAPARVRRFHDAYDALGLRLQAGLLGHALADRLIARGYATRYDKQLQHNQLASLPYGEVEYGEDALGATLEYERFFGQDVQLSVIAGHVATFGRLRDLSRCLYEWTGSCLSQRASRGESESDAHDDRIRERTTFVRLFASWQLHPEHALRVSLAPTWTRRSGENLAFDTPNLRDPLTARSEVFSAVFGLEYQTDLFDDDLQNVAFAKGYLQSIDAEAVLAGGIFSPRDRETLRAGFGDSVRYRFSDWLFAKGAYEWTTRLPRPDELFGELPLILGNVDLEPETSHNVNIGLALQALPTAAGTFHAEIHGALRETDRLITLLGTGKFRYQNILQARSLGVSADLLWTSPGEFLELAANAQHISFRNRSRDGAYQRYRNERIPNRPYLFVNGSARMTLRDLLSTTDALALFWNSRYVHQYYLYWGSSGAPDSKLRTASQLTHAVALTYEWTASPLSATIAAEVLNVTDVKVYDFYGVQRPGRAYSLKVTLAL